jgi:hypothetical protein
VHGGSIRHVKAAAARRLEEERVRRLAEDRVRRALDEQGVREVRDPIAEFMRLIDETIAFKDLLASHVAALEDQLRYTDAAGGEQLRAEVTLYERALDRAGKFLADWARLGMQERMVRISEAQAAALGAALDQAMTDAQVPDDMRRRVRQALADRLRRRS